MISLDMRMPACSAPASKRGEIPGSEFTVGPLLKKRCLSRLKQTFVAQTAVEDQSSNRYNVWITLMRAGIPCRLRPYGTHRQRLVGH